MRDVTSDDYVSSRIIERVMEMDLTVSHTYWNQGFFNVKISFDHLVRSSDGDVSLTFGSQRILGTVNRRAQNNGTARIFGYAPLKHWFQEHPVGHPVIVKFDSPSALTLRRRNVPEIHRSAIDLTHVNSSEDPKPISEASKQILPKEQPLSEDYLKQILKDRLESEGWETTVAWGQQHGVDIQATRAGARWLIEVKGPGSRPEMRHNYFLAILGESLQRMDDSEAKYSIALPDIPQYRRLWNNLPDLAKSRTTLTVLFIDSTGIVTET